MFHVPNNYRYRNPTDVFGSNDSIGNNGLFIFHYGTDIVRCIASDGCGWEHVSVTIQRKCVPNWDLMCHIKNVFWDKEDVVVQFHPTESEYVNNNPYCLHLKWY